MVLAPSKKMSEISCHEVISIPIQVTKKGRLEFSLWSIFMIVNSYQHKSHGCSHPSPPSLRLRWVIVGVHLESTYVSHIRTDRDESQTKKQRRPTPVVLIDPTVNSNNEH